MTDIINELAGIADDSSLGELRASREATFQAAAGSFRELITPADPGGLTFEMRDAIALRIALIERSPAVEAHHRERLAKHNASAEFISAVEAFPEGSAALDPKLVAALAHADLLTRSPRDASPEAIDALTSAGFSVRDIISLSQLIAFVSYEVRLLSMMRILSEEPA